MTQKQLVTSKFQAKKLEKPYRTFKALTKFNEK